MQASDFNLDDGYAASSSKYDKTLINATDITDNRIIGVGIHGIIIYSDDNGRKWNQALVPSTLTLTDIDCIKEMCWATGHDALILRSIDKGETWEKQYNDELFDAPLLSISMFDKMNGIAVGAFANSLRTSNGGIHWETFFITEDEFQPHINHIYTDKDNAYASGELGLFYTSSDRGKNWKTFETGYKGSIWSSLLISENQHLLLGMSGNFLLANKKNNNEYEFTTYNNGVKNTLTKAINLSDKKIAISGLGGVVTIIDFYKDKNISTCVRQDRLGNNSIIQIDDSQLLIIGQNGPRFHSMNDCYKSSLQTNSVNTWVSSKID